MTFELRDEPSRFSDNSARLGFQSDKPKILDLGSAVGRTEEEILSECPHLELTRSALAILEKQFITPVTKNVIVDFKKKDSYENPIRNRLSGIAYPLSK
jgi:hypothetical protein